MSDHADTIRRAEQVSEWANMHGDDLAGALRLDPEDDAADIDAINQALWLVEDVYALLAERQQAIDDAGRFRFLHDKRTTERDEALARCEQAIDALREIAGYPAYIDSRAVSTVMQNIASNALVEIGERG